MNIFDFAMAMEKDGENYYRRLATAATDAGLRSIFTLLAEDEVKHFRVVEQMRNEPGAVPSMAATAVLASARSIFAQLADFKEDYFDPEQPQLEIYRRALELEARSRDFYREKAQVVPAGPQRELLLRLAAEEEEHYRLIDQVVLFVERPRSWLENAEWNHLEEY